MSSADQLAKALEAGLTLPGILVKQADRNGESMYFLDRDGSSRNLPYSELCQQAGQAAQYLIQAGLRPGNAVILCCDDEYDLVRSFWAVLFAGGVAVPLSAPSSYSATDEGLNKIIAVYQQCQQIHGQTPLIISDLELSSLNDIPLWQQTVAGQNCHRPGALFTAVASGQSAPPLPLDPDALAMLMFSSGSTGDPKGVRLTHRQLLNNLIQICERTRVTPEDRSLSWLPLTHDMGLVLFHLCHTLAGIAQYKTTPLTFARDPANFLDLVSKLKISILGMPNFGFDQLLRIAPDGTPERWQLDAVRIIYNGAEPIDPQLCRRFVAQFAPFGLAPWVISPGWGIAEASVTASAFDHHYLEKLGHFPSLWIDADCLITPGSTILTMAPGQAGAREIAALGQAMSGMTIRVLNDEGEVLPPSHLGHLEFSGPNVCHGYFGQPDMPWCQSGDLGFIHDDLIYITGRAKDILFINGRNHYSNDLELALTRQLDWPANQLAVVGITDAVRRREKIVIFFRQTRQADHLAQAGQLRTTLETLLTYPVAAAIGIPALPKTTSGKIRRFALRQALMRGEYDQEMALTEQATQQTLSTMENMVLDLVRQLLPDFPDNIDPVLPLSRYGMDSVAYMQLAFRVSKASGRTLAPHTLLKAASLSQIALEVAQAPQSQQASRLAPQVALTARQSMLWAAWQLAPDSAAYNESYWLQFDGPLDTANWLDAAHKVIAQHGMLNAVIDDGQSASLRLSPNMRADIGFDQGDGNGYVHESAMQVMHNLGNRPFDLRHGPLIRLRLLKKAGGGWYFFVSAHHIVVDGWSLQLLISQIFAHYAGADLPTMEDGLWLDPQSFADADIKQWRNRIHQADAIALPSEIALPDHGSTCIHSHLLPTATFAALQAWQNDGMGNSFSAISGALMVLLARLANIERPVLATVASGRMDAAAEHRIGYYALTLPMTAEIDPVAGFDSLINQIEHQRQDILNGKTPDLASLEPDAGESVASAIRIVYVHQNTPALTLPQGLNTIQTGQLRDLARVDLYITSTPANTADGPDLKFDWEYDSGKFSLGQIRIWAELFEHVLQTLLQAPTVSIGKLSLLSPQQRTLWKPWQDSARAVDFSQNIINRFELAARTWPDYPAISDTGARYSYATLAHKVDALCHLLTDAGLVHGARVCLLTERSAEYVMALLASLKVGAIVVPIDPALPQERINQIATDSGATLLLTTPGVALPSALSEHFPVLCFSAVELQPGQPWHGPQLAFDDSAYLIFTSGSTGKSKGVLNTHRCLINLVDWVVSAFAYQPGETICQFAPFSFDVSIAEILPSLCCGLHIHVLPSERRNSPDLYLQTILEQKVNIATVTPAYLAVLNEIPDRCRQALGSLRLMILGGEALKTDEVRLFRQHSPHVRIVNVYGPTETTVLSTAYPVPQELDLSRPWQPLGLPIANTEIWLLDEHDRVCPATLTGTLYIAGDGLGRGYWQDPEKTDAAFRMLAPGGGQPRRFYCSGDLARLSSSGLLEFVGRADNQIKLRGFRIELGEIEATLERHEKVDAAVVKAVARDGGERVLVAWYSGEPLPAMELDSFLRSSLPNYMIPAFFQYIETWPLTTNRKIDRKLLPEPDWNNQASAESGPPPAGATEQSLAKIWQEVLGAAASSRDDNFFLLGGSSLGAVRLLNRIRQEFGRAPALGILLKHATLSAMAEQIDLAAIETSLAPEHKLAADLEIPATDAQARLVFLDRSHPGMAMNNIPLTLGLSEPLDPARLAEAALALSARHPLLRARFQLDNNGLTMRFNATPQQVLEVLQVGSTQQALDTLQQFHGRPFDTEHGPLWRLMYVQCNDGQNHQQNHQQHQWLGISIHHSIADGVTLMRFLGELDSLYQNHPLPGIENEFSYQDYAVWIKAQLDGEYGLQAQRFWRAPDQTVCLPVLPLKRLSEANIKGRESVSCLTSHQTERLKSLCKEHGCSPFVLMLSLFGFVLGQRLQLRHLTLGVTLDGRSRHEFEQVPGIFVNTLPISFQYQETDYLADLTARVSTRLAQLQEYSDYPLNRVMSTMGQREMPFNILFNEEVLPHGFSFNTHPATMEAIGSGTAKFPLLVSFLFEPEGWRWRLESREKELADTWIEGMQDELQKLIDALEDMGHVALVELESLDADLLALLDLK